MRAVKKRARMIGGAFSISSVSCNLNCPRQYCLWIISG
jgi:hypothetical protein